MNRLGLIEDAVVLSAEEGFLLCDETESGKVILLSVIGRGGTSIAYKGIRIRNGNTAACIVKEYFPAKKEESGIYIRKKTGETISIAEKYKEAELKRQIDNVQRELRTNQELYFSADDISRSDWNNSSYVYGAEYLCRRGDTSYIALDSSDGETLQARLKQGTISVREAFQLIYQMLIIVRHLDRKGYVHCDIKPENLWLRGQGENRSMCLLDFGSAFKLSDYQMDISRMTGRELMDAADRIVENESIGSNTHGYSSLNIGMLESNKSIYSSTDHSAYRAKELLENVNAIGTGDDLFSVVRVAEQILGRTDLTEEERASVRDAWEEIDEKNSDAGFCSVDELKTEIEIIETILHKGAHPAVLERGLRRKTEGQQCREFDSRILCDV